MFMTRRQHEILEFIRQFRKNQGISPTLDEIADSFSVSKVTVFEHVETLVRKGLLRKTRNHARSLEPVSPDPLESPSVPVLGRIAAGRPIEAVENPERLDLNDLVPPGKKIFLLEVEGNSMIDEQIRDGDLVIVEPRTTAQQGETVVAILENGEATLKKYYRERGRIRLQPANPEIAPIHTRHVEIRGVVVGVIRRY